MNHLQDYQNLFGLAGEIALVTGGTAGLGYAIADAFLQNGADVAVCGRNPEKAAELEQTAERFGRRLVRLACDVTDAQQVEQMLDEIAHHLGALSILVNSAGMNRLLPAEDYDPATFAQVLDLNLTATHLVTRAVGKRMMIPAQKGRIVNLSSVKGKIGAKQNYLAYCASKGAVNMYTKQLACEWGKYGITCNAVSPTFVRTDISAKLLDDPIFYQSLCDRIPLGRIGQKVDIAAATMFLCSGAASFITGQILYVDGGITALQ